MTKSFPLVLLATAAALLQPSPAGATNVTNTNDAGAGSLRDCIAITTAGGTVTFDASLAGQTITLGGSQIPIAKSLSIDASTLTEGITIAGNNASRIFNLSGGTANTINLTKLTLTNGSATGNGGAIQNDAILTLTDCALTNNTSTGNGGAIYNTESLTVDRCLLSGNTTPFVGGAINNETSGATLVAINSTFTENTANAQGGGAINSAFDASGTTTIAHCTITNNHAPSGAGAGIRRVNGSYTLENTIVTENNAPTTPDIDGTIATTNGINFVGVPGTATIPGTLGTTLLTTASEGPILLSPLACFGGCHPTFHPLVDSPAIDPSGGTNVSSLTTDARGPGFARVIDGDSPPDATATLDIGAIEAGPVALVTSAANTGAGSLRTAIVGATTPGHRILFDSGTFPATITILTTNLAFNDRTVFLDASDLPAPVVIDGNNTDRALNVISNGNAAFHSIHVTNGNSAGSSGNIGGGLRNDGVATLIKCLFTENTSGLHGGAIQNSGKLSLFDCTLTDNMSGATGFGDGGAIRSSGTGGTTQIVRSTFARNMASRHGGAIYFVNNPPDNAPNTITNSTFANNGTTIHGGAISIANLNVNTHISSSTIAENHAGDQGGGIRSNGPLTLTNTVISRNTSLNIGPDLRNTATATTISLGGNVITNNNGSNGPTPDPFPDGTGPNANGDYVGSNGTPLPHQVAPLADHGGCTQTMPLLNVSFAIDNADTTNTTPPTTDQRGFSRIASPDSGAFETGPVILVNIAADENDPGLGQGTGDSLREALNAIATDRDRIDFDNTVFTGGATNLITLTNGELSITGGKTLAIDASNLSEKITLSGNNSSRVLNIDAGNTLTLAHLIIRDGKAPDGANNPTGSGGNGANGGGIFNAGDLTLLQCTVTENATGDGGDGDSIGFTNGGNGGSGGGIYNDGTGALSLQLTSVDENKTGDGGSATQGGFGGDGGAVYNASGTVTLMDSGISNNYAGTCGPSTGTPGGAASKKGGFRSEGGDGGNGGGIASFGGLVDLIRSALFGNRAGDGGQGTDNGLPLDDGGDGGNGGAIYINDGQLMASNTTLSNNRAGNGGTPGTSSAADGGFGGFGGGIFASGVPDLDIDHATIACNHPGLRGIPSSFSDGEGGGIRLLSNGTLNLENSLFSGNTGGSGSADIDNAGSGTVNTTGANLVGDSTGFIISSGPTPILESDPHLSPLAHYGGPTPSHHLLAGSPAIDAAVATAKTTKYDQRGQGFLREIATAPDLGAVETGPVLLVNTLVDENGTGPDLSLREAIDAANTPGQVIRFDPAIFPGIITLTNNQITANDQSFFIDASNIVQPAGPTYGVVVDGNSPGTSSGRIFNFDSDNTIALHSLSLTNAHTTSGGGAIRSGARSRNTIINSALYNNIATQGAGIFSISSSAFYLINSTLTQNIATNGGGAAIRANGTASVENSTIAGNTSDAGSGAGIRSTGDGLTLKNTIVAQNTAAGTDPDLSGNFTTNGGNLIGDNTGVTSTFPAGTPNPNTDQVGTAGSPLDPKLDPFAQNGGPTPTFALQYDSPALDNGEACTPPTDQRGHGFARHRPAVLGSPHTIDIGAYESNPIILVDEVADENATTGPGDTSLREAIGLAPDILSDPFGTRILFDPAVFDGQPADIIHLGVGGASGQLTISSQALEIDGASSGATGVTIDGDVTGDGPTNDDSRVFFISGSASDAVIFRHLTITGGYPGFFVPGGGINIAASTPVSLHHVTVAGNTADTEGGGISGSGGDLSLTNCTVTDNATILGFGSSGGGGILYSGNSFRLVHSTIARNSATIIGAGISVGVTGAFEIDSSIIAENSALSNADININLGTLTDLGNNFIGDNSSVSALFPPGAPNANGDFVGTTASPLDPLLSPLAHYGGNTFTMPPAPGSLAHENATKSAILVGQRQVARPAGNLPDIGAVEGFCLTSPPFVDTDNDGMDDTLEVLYGFTVNPPNDTEGAEDADGDGSTNAEELANKTNPLDPNDLLRILKLDLIGVNGTTGDNIYEVTWTCYPGLTYNIIADTLLNFPASIRISPNITPTTLIQSATFEVDPATRNDFFTIRRN
ncbi:MAG: right-handed parallel beta-helix repeat-containing protein [Verrucomicrobiota bacterium]